MIYEVGICKNCGQTRNIVNKKHYLCQICNRSRLHPNEKPKSSIIHPNRFNEKYPYDTRWGFVKEMEMFLWIWADRPHVSFISGQPLHYFSPAQCAHVLPKALNKYPMFRLNPENVILVTTDEHKLIDEGTEDKRKAYPGSWEAFNILREQLLWQYQAMFESR